MAYDWYVVVLLIFGTLGGAMGLLFLMAAIDPQSGKPVSEQPEAARGPRAP